MREELYRTFYVARPKKTRDMYGHVTVSGYENLRTYQTLVVEGAVRGSVEVFGYTPSGDLEILFTDDKREDIRDEDGVWLTEPEPSNGLYQSPAYIIKSSREFNGRRVYSAGTAV